MAGRILGMGDVLSFVEKAQEVVSATNLPLLNCSFYPVESQDHLCLFSNTQQMRQEDAEELQKKIMSAKFDFNDFLKQTRAVAQMGSMSRVIGMIPGMGKV